MSKELRPLALWTMAIEYLHLVETVAAEIALHGNSIGISVPRGASDQEVAQLLEAETKWSDVLLAVPVFFNFYHGVELLLKGFLLVKGVSKRTHCITELYTSFCREFPDESLAVILKPYVLEIDPRTSLGRFLRKNSISIDQYYEALKYPISNHGVDFLHHPLKYNTEEGAEYFQTLNLAVASMRRRAVALSRDLDEYA